MPQYQPITEREWREFEWLEVSTFLDWCEGRSVFVRGGVKHNRPNVTFKNDDQPHKEDCFDAVMVCE